MENVGRIGTVDLFDGFGSSRLLVSRWEEQIDAAADALLLA